MLPLLLCLAIVFFWPLSLQVCFYKQLGLPKENLQWLFMVNGILSPLFAGSMVLTMSAAGILKEQFSLVAMFETAAFLFLIGLIVILPLYNLRVETKTEVISSQE